jgi:Domain of unknown function (DUF4153)
MRRPRTTSHFGTIAAPSKTRHLQAGRDCGTLRRMKQPLPSVRIVAAEVARVAARFPLVVLCAVAGAASAIVAIEADGAVLANVVMASALGLPLMFGLRILRERWTSGGIRGQLIEAAGILLLVGYCFTVPPHYNWRPADIGIRFLVLDVGMHFAVAFVPCLTGAGEWEYWQFNRRLFLRFALAALYSAVLYIGFALAMVSSDKLFDLGIDGHRYAELWILMVGIFNPLFFLGGVPRKWDEGYQDESYPRALRGFAQFALAPLVIVFVAILYLYGIKILRAWSWPHGWVAMPVCCLSVVGILASLLLQPARTIDGERWARWYWKYFFRALGPLSILLLLSLGERISVYGVTESRFYGLIIGGWLLATAVYFTIRPGGSTRLIPASLAVLCFLSVAGPWNAFSISSASQERHLIAVLSPFGAVENGRLVPAKTTLPEKDRNAVSSILNHLIETYGSKRFPDLLAGFEASPKGSKKLNPEDANDYIVVTSIISYITGAENPYANRHNQAERQSINVNLDMKEGLPVAGYRAVYHACVCPGSAPQKLGDLSLQFFARGQPPKIIYRGDPVATSEVEALLTAIETAGTKGIHSLPPSGMSAKLASGSREWLLVVDQFGALPEKTGRPTLTELNIYVLEK